MAEVKNAGSIVKATSAKASKKEPTIESYVQNYLPQIQSALPNAMTPERFAHIVVTAVKKTPKLGECELSSLFASMLTAAQLGLEPNTPLGQAYLIPYGNQVQFQIGYKGLMDLAFRSGDVVSIDARSVYENDKFTFSYGLHNDIVHEPALKDRGDLLAFYAVVHLRGGGAMFEVMSVEDVRRHAAQFSKASSGPWQTNFEAMAKKTVIKRVLKYAPLRSEVISAMAADEHTMNVTMPEDGSAAIVSTNYEVIEEYPQEAVTAGVK